MLDGSGELPIHPRLASLFDPVIIPYHLRINGLLKFHLRVNDPSVPQRNKDILSAHQKNRQNGEITGAGDVSYLPPSFGCSTGLDATDLRLFKFCA